MAATYVNNLRVAEPADGDADWGTTTNASLELIGEALGKEVVKGSIPGFLAYLLVPFSYIKSVREGTPSTRTLDTIHTGKTGNKIVPSTLAREELNHNPRPIMDTVVDFVKFYSDRGLIKI